MRKCKKILSVVLAMLIMAQLVMVSVYAANVQFPLPLPQVGVMKIKASESGRRAVGLRTNGTINVYGFDKNTATPEFFNRVYAIADAVDVACASNGVFVLHANGLVEYINPLWGAKYNYASKDDMSGYDFSAVSTWQNIIAIDAGDTHLVGLCADGTVCAAGRSANGQLDVYGFKEIVSISAKDDYTVGINKDGRVYMAGAVAFSNETRRWTNVKQIVQGQSVIYGLQEDGTILTATTLSGSFYKDIHTKLSAKGVGKVVDIAASYSDDIYVIDDKGDAYSYDLFGGTLEKITERAIYLCGRNGAYFVLDADGMIFSNKAAFQSDDWIMTTNMTYNGKKISADVPPYIKDGRTLAPIRVILETLGMAVSWNDATKTATAISGGTVINITIGLNVAMINGQPKKLDVPAEITNGRTFVPVRFFAEALDMNVEWDNYTRTVAITSK